MRTLLTTIKGTQNIVIIDKYVPQSSYWKPYMKVQFLGATETVTGSKFLVESKKKTQILIDCGLFQGLKKNRLRNWETLKIDLENLKAVVLTHAHIDHSGYLPALYKQGYRGPIYCSPATKDLCRIMLPDSGKIQEEDANYANRKGFSKHKPALPLYSEKEGRAILDLFETVDYGEDLQINDFHVQLYRAGHILGSTSIRLSSHGQSAIFSGDIGRSQDILMKPTQIIPSADWILMESTYGNRLHPTSDYISELSLIINDTIKRGGSILIPAFAVGRAQSLIYLVNELKKSKSIGNIPVYLDSPMACDVSELYKRYQDEHILDDEQIKGLFSQTQFVNSFQESMGLNEDNKSKIIISASGMLTGGRVLHHFATMAPDPRNTVILAGFQAPGTRGSDLLNGELSIKLLGQWVDVKCEVFSLPHFSAHADQSELLAWLKAVKESAKGVILIHGEPEAQDVLRKKIEDQLKMEVFIPRADSEMILT